MFTSSRFLLSVAGRDHQFLTSPAWSCVSITLHHRKHSFLVAFASLFADTSTEMLYPVLPVFLTQTLNASGSIVGLAERFAQATQNYRAGLFPLQFIDEKLAEQMIDSF